ncbi:hypothetical protein BT69DRAFT_1348791 [Atractiella rhizophila]|nr:hypothetical protein BT69DRAFT_1348791 [Atractiella rhizophila]
MNAFLTAAALISVATAQYSATYTPGSLPNQTESGQEGYNICGTANSQDSRCQTAYFNSLNDFCVWAPPTPGEIGSTERFEVAWCTKPGYGTRLIPDGTIQGAHWVETPDYVQITGYGDFTTMNVVAGDSGGELDPHGADGNGNPIGGIVFTSAFGGGVKQAHEWTNFMSATEFCFRVCKDGPNAWLWCQHIYDVMGCGWNNPGDYTIGTYDSCDGDSGQYPGIYDGSTFHQDQGNTPLLTLLHPSPTA